MERIGKAVMCSSLISHSQQVASGLSARKQVFTGGRRDHLMGTIYAPVGLIPEFYPESTAGIKISRPGLCSAWQLQLDQASATPMQPIPESMLRLPDLQACDPWGDRLTK